LRLLILNTDTESTEVLQKIVTLLKVRDFHVHAVGKYTVLVHKEKPEKIMKIKKSPKTSHFVIAILVILLSIFGIIAFMQFIRG
jgi:hypothetical protein